MIKSSKLGSAGCFSPGNYDIIFAVRKDKEIPAGFFWDTDSSRLDLRKNKDYIIERILELGDEKAVKWLFSNYSRNEIRRVLAASRRISRKSANYWSLVLK